MAAKLNEAFMQARFSPSEEQRLGLLLSAWPKNQQKAVLAALRETGTAGCSKIIKRIMERYTLKRKYVARYVGKPYVNKAEQTLEIHAYAPKSIPIINFAGKMGKHGWRPKVMKGGKFSDDLPYTFTGKGKNSGKLLVFQRSGEDRQKRRGGVTRPSRPIKVVPSTSGLQFMQREEEVRDLMQFLRLTYMAKLMKRTKLELGKLAGGK